MDPNVNLEAQRKMAARIMRGEPSGDMPTDAEHLAALVVALDNWLKRGGKLPRDWDKALARVQVTRS
jgi:hypothetical protein